MQHSRAGHRAPTLAASPSLDTRRWRRCPLDFFRSSIPVCTGLCHFLPRCPQRSPSCTVLGWGESPSPSLVFPKFQASRFLKSSHGLCYFIDPPPVLWAPRNPVEIDPQGACAFCWPFRIGVSKTPLLKMLISRPYPQRLSW